MLALFIVICTVGLDTDQCTTGETGMTFDRQVECMDIGEAFLDRVEENYDLPWEAEAWAYCAVKA